MMHKTLKKYNCKIIPLVLFLLITAFALTFLLIKHTKNELIPCPTFINDAHSLKIEIYGSLYDGSIITLNKETDFTSFEKIANIFTSTKYARSSKYYGSKGRNSKLTFYDEFDKKIGEITIHTPFLVKINSWFYYPQEELDYMLIHELLQKTRAHNRK